MKILLLLFALASSSSAAAQTKTDTLALEAHAKNARYSLVGQGARVTPGDSDYYKIARRDYDRLIAGGRSKNLLYRAAICKIKSQGMAFDAQGNAEKLLIAKQGLQDVMAYEKLYGANAESARYKAGLEANIQTLSSKY